MAHATFRQPLTDDLAPLMAKGYGSSDQPPWPFFETITDAPAGALSASGADMGRFVLALLHGGALDGARVLSEESLASMMAPQIVTASGSMGLVFIETRVRGIRFVGHGGGTMSFFSQLLVSPENRLGLFISCDGRLGAQALEDLLQAFAQRYLPTQPPGGSSFTARPGDAAAVAGAYQTSRRADSTILRLDALTSQVLIRPRHDATIVALGGPFGTGQSLQEIGELLFRGPKGNEIAFEEGPSHAMRLNIGAPVLQWQRVPWHLDIRVIAPALVSSALISVLTLLAWPIAAVLRRRRGRRWSEDASMRRCHLAARLVLILQMAVIVATTALFVAGTANSTILSDALDPALIVLYGCAWLGVLGGVVAFWVAWQFWRKRVGGLWTRIHHTLIAASAAVLAWFFLNWHIAGTTLNY